MSVTYRNPPLVELIAELRWYTPLPGPQQGNALQLMMPTPKSEELYMQLGAVMSREGFSRIERLFPPGAPTPVTQVVYRYRPTPIDEESPLFQVGPAIFTVNALPPSYKSWNEFCPIVERGLGYLFEAHDRVRNPRPTFTSAVIRYIDAFDDRFTGGRDSLTFMADVLGIKVDLPEPITAIVKQDGSITPTIRLSLPVNVGDLDVNLGLGRKGNEAAVMLDCTVTIKRQMGADVGAALAALTEGRTVIHNLFRGLTGPLHEAMEPVS